MPGLVSGPEAFLECYTPRATGNLARARLTDARRNCGSPAPAMRVKRHLETVAGLGVRLWWTPTGEGLGTTLDDESGDVTFR